MLNWREIDEDLFEGYEYLGWNEETKAILMARFISETGRAGDFDSFLAALAAVERHENRGEEEGEDDEEEDLESPGPVPGRESD